jgi:uncharacterized protein
MRSRIFRRRALGSPLIIFIAACLASGSDADYIQSVEKWRQAYLADLTSDTGWLTVSGLFWLHDGENRFGSDAHNDIVLPAESAPPHAGVFDYHAGKTIVHMDPSAPATLGGKPLQTAELKPDSKADRIVLGDLTLYVHASGDRLAIRMKDKNSKIRKNFKGLNWFPVDESYRTTAQYFPFEAPKEMESENVLGDRIRLAIVGYVTFPLRGHELRLEVEKNSDGGFFIVFRDLTSGKETYPASRFLDTDPPQDGPHGKSVELDFNKAYNPPCAYNPYTTCPIPLPGNRLRVALPVGEKIYKHEHEN